MLNYISRMKAVNKTQTICTQWARDETQTIIMTHVNGLWNNPVQSTQRNNQMFTEHTTAHNMFCSRWIIHKNNFPLTGL